MNEKFSITFSIWACLHILIPVFAFYSGWNISCVDDLELSEAISCTDATYPWYYVSAIGLGSVVLTALSCRLKEEAFDVMGINIGLIYTCATVALFSATFNYTVLFWFGVIIAPLLALISSHYHPPDEWYWRDR